MTAGFLGFEAVPRSGGVACVKWLPRRGGLRLQVAPGPPLSPRAALRGCKLAECLAEVSLGSMSIPSTCTSASHPSPSPGEMITIPSSITLM